MKKNLALLTATLIAALAFTGCSTATKPAGMKVSGLTPGKTIDKTVAVQTGGGHATNPAWTSQIADKDLATAITESLKDSRLFKSVVSIGDAEYVLSATIINLNQPVIGFTMSVHTEILWRLVPKNQTKAVWEKSIATSATKGVGDAFAGVTRVRITTESAVQENIRQALTQISKAPLN